MWVLCVLVWYSQPLPSIFGLVNSSIKKISLKWRLHPAHSMQKTKPNTEVRANLFQQKMLSLCLPNTWTLPWLPDSCFIYFNFNASYPLFKLYLGCYYQPTDIQPILGKVALPKDLLIFETLNFRIQGSRHHQPSSDQ